MYTVSHHSLTAVPGTRREGHLLRLSLPREVMIGRNALANVGDRPHNRTRLGHGTQGLPRKALSILRRECGGDQGAPRKETGVSQARRLDCGRGLVPETEGAEPLFRRGDPERRGAEGAHRPDPRSMVRYRLQGYPEGGGGQARPGVSAPALPRGQFGWRLPCVLGAKGTPSATRISPA
jgi:hypothetical protein